MAGTARSTADKRRAFHALHQTGCFVIPNPWDIGSARYLQGLGFKALATTSSGCAWSLGRPDGGLSRSSQRQEPWLRGHVQPGRRCRPG